MDREIFCPTVESALKEARRQAKGPGGIPEEWKTDENSHKLAQKDTDLRGHKAKSKIRVRIEHIFGFMTVSMHEITLRCIGKHRANFNIGFTDLVYTICRAEILSRVGA